MSSQILRAETLRTDGTDWQSFLDDMVFFTQITMEAAEDVEFLDAMRKPPASKALSWESNP